VGNIEAILGLATVGGYLFTAVVVPYFELELPVNKDVNNRR
jgi:hypothetical protein